jgi:hypothetical protein
VLDGGVARAAGDGPEMKEAPDTPRQERPHGAPAPAVAEPADPISVWGKASWNLLERRGTKPTAESTWTPSLSGKRWTVMKSRWPANGDNAANCRASPAC